AALDPKLYFAINGPAAVTGALTNVAMFSDSNAVAAAAAHAATWANGLNVPGAPITGDQLVQAAQSVGETQIISKTGGAPTLAIGMAEIFHQMLGGAALKEFWYHFAIMFEALFILTTVDAGTRVARFMLSDALGNLPGFFRRFRNPSWRIGNWVCSVIVVAAWGSILVMGITDPLGGINTLYPLFGISNQLLAAIALTLVTVVVIKKGKLKWAWIPGIGLVWDLIVTLTASAEKAFSKVQAIGYWTQHQCYVAARDAANAGSISPTNGVYKYTSTSPTCSVSGTMANFNAVIRNTMVQEILQIVFALCVIVVVVVGVVVSVKAIRAGSLPTTEEPEVTSHLFAARELALSGPEKVVAAQWAEYNAAHAGTVIAEAGLEQLAADPDDPDGGLEPRR
ncbi:MAG: hypothetical protein FWF75_08995, partial [Propionibacteriaceae bacterium]|nr:hypothetical protein [Propionibacteriaceae bacterium]